MATWNGIHYTDTGCGKITLLFLHFFGGSSSSWNGVIGALSQNYRCIAIDFYGFGKSSAPLNGTSLNSQANLVSQLANELQLKDFILIGHSMGGKIALAIASRQHVGLRSIVLIAPSPPTPEPITDADRSTIIKAFGKRLEIEGIVKKLTASPLDHTLFESVVNGHLDISESAWNTWLQQGSREDISSEMHNITVPLSVISGSGDTNFSTSFLRQEFRKYFSHAQFIEVSLAGHLIPLEKPAAASLLISAFAGN